MSIELISILIVLAMLVLMALGLPLAWSIGAVAVALTLYLFEPGVLMMLVARVFDMSLNYTLMAVPLFVLMAGILQRSGVAEDLFDAVHVWAGGLRGGWRSARSSPMRSWLPWWESSGRKLLLLG